MITESTTAGFVSTVERYYIVLRRQGLMLSPYDQHIIEGWQSRNIPAHVVCRGLLKAVTDFRESHGPDARFPRTLDAFESAIENAFAEEKGCEREPAAFDGLMLSDTLVAQAFDPQVEDPKLVSAYSAAWTAISKAETNATNVLALADQVSAQRCLESLNDEERALLDQLVDERLAPERAHLGQQGLAIRREAVLEDLIHERYGLARLKDNR